MSMSAQSLGSDITEMLGSTSTSFVSSSISGQQDIEEEDLTKDNSEYDSYFAYHHQQTSLSSTSGWKQRPHVGTPIDSAGRVQAERIEFVLDEAICKMKLVLSLPYLVAEYDFLDSILSTKDMVKLKRIFESYGTYHTDINPKFVMMTFEAITAGQISRYNRISPEMANLIFILSSYPELKKKAFEIVDEVMESYQYEAQMPVSLRFLLRMEDVKANMLKLMVTSAADQIKRCKKIEKLTKVNNGHIAKINDLSETLSKEQEAHDAKMKTKVELIEELNRTLEKMSCDAENEVSKLVHDTDRGLVLAARAHETKMASLKNRLLQYRLEFEALTVDNQSAEEVSRERKFKAEQTLLDWLRKYDEDMSLRQVELDKITEMLEEEQEKCIDLQEKLDVLDEEYLPLMEEREAEYQEEMLQKMMKFREERCARVIQRVWRTVLWNRKEKKRVKRERLAEIAEKKRIEKEEYKRYIKKQKMKMVESGKSKKKKK